MNKIVVILNGDLKVGAFLDLNKEPVKTEYYNGLSQEDLKDFFDYVSKHKLKAKAGGRTENGDYLFGLVEVDRQDVRYSEAVALELQNRGFGASVVLEAAKNALLTISDDSISLTQREEVIGDIINSPSEDLGKLDEIFSIINEIKEIQEKKKKLL